MTELLYLTDTEAAYRTRFEAKVVARPPGGVVLDRTLFYPVGGGQPADRGELVRSDGGRWAVVDVARQGGTVLHRLEKERPGRPGPVPGDTVAGTVDWTRRYGHMRCHTAQHLLSARLFTRTGIRTSRAIFGGGRGRIELEGAWPAALSVAEVDSDLRGYVDRGLPVRIRFLPRAEYDQAPAARSGLIPLAPQIDPVRVIEIEGIDLCPCGGTHLANTREIGPFTLAPVGSLASGQAVVEFQLGPTEPPTPSG